MRKIIDIPDENVIDLKILAAKENLNLKAYIEKILNELVKKAKNGAR